MPQQQQSSSGSNATATKKKKKGRTPAHQNQFAFRHNPKSKKTAQILESPIAGVCRRCHDKLEWRKRYRKYKPLTQPAKCNLCRRSNVRAAYHTICGSCAQSSEKAVAVLNEWCAAVGQETSSNSPNAETTTEPNEASAAVHEDNEEKDDTDSEHSNENVAEDELPSITTTPSASNKHNTTAGIRPTRVCAVCVKEPALPDDNDELAPQASSTVADRPLRLRKVKALERQRERAAHPHQRTATAANDPDNNIKDDLNHEMNELDIHNDYNDDDSDDDDPFLRAVGGAEQLVTGEAYQQKLMLRKEQQHQQQE